MPKKREPTESAVAQQPPTPSRANEAADDRDESAAAFKNGSTQFPPPMPLGDGSGGGLRVAPWPSEHGGFSFIAGARGSFMDRLADVVEADELDYVRHVLTELEDVDPTQQSVSRDEVVRHLARAANAAEKALRVADLRGLRLASEEA